MLNRKFSAVFTKRRNYLLFITSYYFPPGDYFPFAVLLFTEKFSVVYFCFICTVFLSSGCLLYIVSLFVYLLLCSVFPSSIIYFPYQLISLRCYLFKDLFDFFFWSTVPQTHIFFNYNFYFKILPLVNTSSVEEFPITSVLLVYSIVFPLHNIVSECLLLVKYFSSIPIISFWMNDFTHCTYFLCKLYLSSRVCFHRIIYYSYIFPLLRLSSLERLFTLSLHYRY